MSDQDQPLLDASSEHPQYRSVNIAEGDTASPTVVVQPPGGRGDAYDNDVGPGAGCVSFHNVSYEVSRCFGLKKKVILNSVR